MPYQLPQAVVSGLLGPFPWWAYFVIALTLTHVTIACVTIFLHRAQAHRALDFTEFRVPWLVRKVFHLGNEAKWAPAEHFFRLWLWLTTGMVTKEWVAIHRKHHAKVETPDDPHSPQTRGIGTVFWRGTELYRAEAKNVETIEKYGKGTPDDWIERNVYTRFSWQGVGLMLVVNLMLLGPIGLTIWAVQMAWIPVTAAGIINGVGHYWGYRNFDPPDASTNIVPWGILIGGEELHNNHHTYPTSAKLSARWYEFDLGWMYIWILEHLGLARVNKTIPILRRLKGKTHVDTDTVHAVTTLRYELLARWDKLAKKLSTELEGRKEELALLRSDLVRTWEDASLKRSDLVTYLRDWRERARAHGHAKVRALAEELTQYAVKYRSRSRG